MSRSKETPSFDTLNALNPGSNTQPINPIINASVNLNNLNALQPSNMLNVNTGASPSGLSQKSNSSKFSFRKTVPMDFNNNMGQNDVSPITPKASNQFFFASPLTRQEPYKDNRYSNEEFLSSENIDPAGKQDHYQADNYFFSSPTPQKKIKQNIFVSPNMMDLELLKSDAKNREIRDQYRMTAFPNFGGQDYFNNFNQSPMNFKLESPSNMMNFRTPERPLDAAQEGNADKKLFPFSLGGKSPNLATDKKFFFF